MSRRLTARLLLLLVAGTFIWAGAQKAWDPQAFVRQIDAFRLLPWAGAVAVALWLPWLELVAALALLVRPWRAAGGTVIAVLLLVFLTALMSAWWRGIDVACGCFGDGGGRGVAWPLARDVLLLAALGLGLFWNRGGDADEQA